MCISPLAFNSSHAVLLPISHLLLLVSWDYFHVTCVIKCKQEFFFLKKIMHFGLGKMFRHVPWIHKLLCILFVVIFSVMTMYEYRVQNFVFHLLYLRQEHYIKDHLNIWGYDFSHQLTKYIKKFLSWVEGFYKLHIHYIYCVTVITKTKSWSNKEYKSNH